MGMKFVLEVSEDLQAFTATRKVEMSVSDQVGLSQVLESFGDFLRAAGFHFNGQIEVVDDSEEEVSEGSGSHTHTLTEHENGDSDLEDTIRYSTAGALGAELEYAMGEVAESERE